MNNDKITKIFENCTVDLFDGELNTIEAVAHYNPCKMNFFSSKSINEFDNAALSVKNLTMASSAAMSNADVCMLDGAAIKTLAVRYPSDAQYVMARLVLRSSWLLGLPGLLRRLALGRVKLGGLFILNETPSKLSFWLIIKRTKKTTQANRLLLPNSIGVETFLSWLKNEQINYVVPRFFEQLPNLHRNGGDLDLLVADEHADKVIDKIKSYAYALTDRVSDSVPIGMHSISLAAGIPYFPPQLAVGVLERSIEGPAGSRVPTPIDELHMLIYHALYHSKSYSTGIPSAYNGKMENPPENDYFGIIQEKAKRLCLNVGSTMEELDQYMAQVGWQPKRDTLQKISEKNVWVRDHFFGDQPPRFTGLTVFILKEAAVANGLTEKVVEMMSSSGVKIVDVLRLTAEQKERAIREIRGGNWTGPQRKTEGLFPAAFIIGVDPNCVGLKSKHAYEYERVWSKKHKSKVREKFDVDGAASIVHAADNTFEAIEYLEACLDRGEREKVFEKIDRAISGVRFAYAKRAISYNYLSHLVKFNLRDYAVKILS